MRNTQSLTVYYCKALHEGQQLNFFGDYFLNLPGYIFGMWWSPLVVIKFMVT